MPTIEAVGVDFYYREAGAGPPVVMAHADASSSGQWQGLMDDLGREFRCIAFDAAGQARSGPWPDGTPYDMAIESKVVDALCAGEEGPIHLVGHSAGGCFAVAAALRLGDRVASLSLVEPALWSVLRDGGATKAWAEIERVARQFRSLVADGRVEEAMKEFVDYWTVPGAWDKTPASRREAMLATAPKICLEWEASFGARDVLSRCALLRCPVLLVRGGATTVAGGTTADLVRPAIVDCSFKVIEGAGHMSPITHAREVFAQISAHIRAHSQPSPARAGYGRNHSDVVG